MGDEQKPVAWMGMGPNGATQVFLIADLLDGFSGWKTVPLYLHPAPVQSGEDQVARESMTQDMVIEQGDRDLAASLWEELGERTRALAIRGGSHDQSVSVQKCAAHRLKATKATGVVELREALDWALAEIEGRTRYTPDIYIMKEQRDKCLQKCRNALALTQLAKGSE